MSDRISCGTSMGLRLHIDLGEPLCAACAPLAIRNCLTNERRQPNPAAELQQLRNLQSVIHILAQAMSSKAGAP